MAVVLSHSVHTFAAPVAQMAAASVLAAKRGHAADPASQQEHSAVYHWRGHDRRRTRPVLVEILLAVWGSEAEVAEARQALPVLVMAPQTHSSFPSGMTVGIAAREDLFALLGRADTWSLRIEQCPDGALDESHLYSGCGTVRC